MKIKCAYCGKVFECHPEKFQERYKEPCLKIKWKESDKNGNIVRICTCYGCIKERWQGRDSSIQVCHP